MPLYFPLIMLMAFLSFLISASAGLGGSLLLVPCLCLALGTKQGIALAAVMLGLNNIGKAIAYWQVIPFKAALMVILMTIIGSAVGANVMVAVPETWVSAGVIISILLSFLFERRNLQEVRTPFAIPLAFLAGATSGFSGTSGPLKGIALRNLKLNRLNLVGAASAVSLAADVTKSLIYVNASLITADSTKLLIACVPLMFIGVFLGRKLNTLMGEQGYSIMFWLIMSGYSLRLILS